MYNGHILNTKIGSTNFSVNYVTCFNLFLDLIVQEKE